MSSSLEYFLPTSESIFGFLKYTNKRVKKYQACFISAELSNERFGVKTAFLLPYYCKLKFSPRTPLLHWKYFEKT